MTEENGKVTFTVKELLARLDQKIDIVSNKIDDRFTDHEARIRKLEEFSLTDDALTAAQKSFRNSVYKATGAAVSVVGLGMAVASYFF